ncbi:cardiolipin synthase [Aestuariicella hydrocarbonica]|uniref:Cardiolipin synthase n=2 Tax=Pseudomaricurvus hydrocarbonicus TaxID=1470433 RepID=A0A9E5MLX2_9GAMM|nr:cardiolipin synthase [Aestuariicella hydrocarbonica]NHO65708.1 cardiolipin synthase [Aestuariicella hydrocarbonica]
MLGCISAVHAVLYTRTEQGAIAWSISLISFPYIALPLYWFLGRNRFKGYVSARKLSQQLGVDVLLDRRETLAPYILNKDQLDPATLAAERLAAQPMLGGNAVELLVDGEATFNDIISGIFAAKEYILFQFFIIKDDGLGRRIKESLKQKASVGIRIYFLYDEVGSHSLSVGYLQELRDAGIKVAPFNTRKGHGNRFQLNFRNHRKIVVTDGKVCWIGGHNVGDEYLGLNAKFGHWRDTHVRIEGPASLGAQLSFIQDWHWATETILNLNWDVPDVAPGKSAALILPTGPADELESASLMFTQAINSARSRIWIASPYFIPDRSVLNALQLAGLRGVDVRILIPEMPDHYLVYLAGFSYLEEAGLTGVRFFRYADGFLHEKAMLIDERVATIGTANFDNRSFRLNFEITAVIADDPVFINKVELMFNNDFQSAREVSSTELYEKPWWFQFAVKFARLTSPIQ